MKFISVWFVVVVSQWAFAQNFDGLYPVEDNRACFEEKKIALNSWVDIGTSGPTCRAENLGNALRALSLYQDFIVDGRRIEVLKNDGRRRLSVASDQYIIRYGTNILNLMDAMSEKFLVERARLEREARHGQPLSETEKMAWMNLIRIIAFQEFRLTHYQYQDDGDDEISRLRVAVGDPVFKEGSDGKYYHVKDSAGHPLYRSQGMFQHFSTSVTSERGRENFDLVTNIQNGIEHVYNHWARILGYKSISYEKLRRKFAGCRGQIHTSGGLNYQNAIRASYGMYNGGDMSICRFADSDTKYNAFKRRHPECEVDGRYGTDRVRIFCEKAQVNEKGIASTWVTDRRIANHIRSAPWARRLGVSDEDRTIQRRNQWRLPFDLDCVRDQNRFCPHKSRLTEGLQVSFEEMVKDKLFRMQDAGDEAYCIYYRDFRYVPARMRLYCTHQENFVPCLRNLQGFDKQNIRTTSGMKSYYSVYDLPIENSIKPDFIDNPMSLCYSNRDGIYVSGQLIQAKQKIPIYKSISQRGKIIGFISKNQIKQILDFDIVMSKGFERWYRVEVSDSSDGYVYAGGELDWQKYFSENDRGSVEASEIVLPRRGDHVIWEQDMKTYIKPDDDKLTFGATQPAKLLAAGTTIVVTNIFYLGKTQKIVLRAYVSNENESSAFYIPLGQLKTNSPSIRRSSVAGLQIVGPLQGNSL